MAQEETPRQDSDPDLDIRVIFPVERPYGYNRCTRASERLNALRGTPCGERVSRLDEQSEIAWQTLHDARRNQDQSKNLLEKSDEIDERFDRICDKIDATLNKLHKTLIIGFISLCGIGVAGTALIVTLLIFLHGGK